ncbi:putative retrotransposon hot spot (RHS) protein [Trypanosoma cruzi]|uniref:Putative retrotransposon hot spot (RHS) protein n=1 Tax=Trypanosoma cruzi TaxID=5693 RepID=A0A2V2WH29_TRYCR|nr:putative retrotransposon hot spot (RHS) protein [Trypanosoma cruzi]
MTTAMAHPATASTMRQLKGIWRHILTVGSILTTTCREIICAQHTDSTPVSGWRRCDVVGRPCGGYRWGGRRPTRDFGLGRHIGARWGGVVYRSTCLARGVSETVACFSPRTPVALGICEPRVVLGRGDCIGGAVWVIATGLFCGHVSEEFSACFLCAPSSLLCGLVGRMVMDSLFHCFVLEFIFIRRSAPAALC